LFGERGFDFANIFCNPDLGRSLLLKGVWRKRFYKEARNIGPHGLEARMSPKANTRFLMRLTSVTAWKMEKCGTLNPCFEEEQC
jgi:streptomycin 6-kinase